MNIVSLGGGLGTIEPASDPVTAGHIRRSRVGFHARLGSRKRTEGEEVWCLGNPTVKANRAKSYEGTWPNNNTMPGAQMLFVVLTVLLPSPTACGDVPQEGQE